MSTDVLPMGNNEPGMPSRFMHRFDTHGIWGLFVFLAMGTVLTATGMSDGFDMWFWIGLGVQTPYVVLMFTATRRHRVLMCPHCVEAFPLNPGETAAGRARFALRYFHIVFDGIQSLLWLGERLLRSRILSMVAVAALTWGVAWSLSRVLDYWYGVMVVTGLILLAYAVQRHKQLEIWCPWCDHGNGGDDDDDPPQPEPEPDPGVDAKTDQLSKTG